MQISLDGRGTPAPKGAAWRKAIYRKIGIINIRDQAMAAKKIMNWRFVDTSRIAVWGWSGGGSTTLNLLFQYPEIYKTGIAIAPVANAKKSIRKAPDQSPASEVLAGLCGILLG
jgi:dipeptidyl-peptidase-4